MEDKYMATTMFPIIAIIVVILGLHGLQAGQFLSQVLAVVVLVGWIYAVYVQLISKRNKVQEAFSAIDVQLKKRYDLIPNILTIAQKYMDHERGILEEVTKLRAQVMGISSSYENIDKKIALDNEISQKMGQIKVAMENYPELKADQTLVTAQQTYNEVEEHIAAARRFYNSAANELKNAVEIFPSSFIARMMNIKSVDFFKAAEIERQSVDASQYLK